MPNPSHLLNISATRTRNGEKNRPSTEICCEFLDEDVHVDTCGLVSFGILVILASANTETRVQHKMNVLHRVFKEYSNIQRIFDLHCVLLFFLGSCGWKVSVQVKVFSVGPEQESFSSWTCFCLGFQRTPLGC